MTIQFMDGLDLHSSLKDMTRRGWVPGVIGTASIEQNAGRFGSGYNSHRLRNNAAETSRTWLPLNISAMTTWVIQGAFNFGAGQSAGTPSNCPLFHACTRQTSNTFNSATAGIWLGYNHSAGQFEVRRGGSLGSNNGTLLQSASFTMSDATWYYIELRIVQSATVGTITLVVNGSTLINTTNENTGAAGVNLILFQTNGGNADRRSLDIDDIVVSDGALIGDRRIYTLSANADTADADYTPDSGMDNYARVDERPGDGDTSYVFSGTPGDMDIYQLENIAVIPGAISAVQVCMHSRKDDAGPRSNRLKTVSGATTDNGTTMPVGTNYDMVTKLFENDPNGGTWNQSSVNALKAGMELVA